MERSWGGTGFVLCVCFFAVGRLLQLAAAFSCTLSGHHASRMHAVNRRTRRFSASWGGAGFRNCCVVLAACRCRSETSLQLCIGWNNKQATSLIV